MQLVKNQKGSTLMLVVITVAILSVLGTALLSMSLMNVNMKASDYLIKRSSYYAESGIDQVYARVNRLVEEGINHSIAETDVYMKTILSDLERWSTSIPPTTEPDLSTWQNYTMDVEGEIMLDSEALAMKAREIYRENFRLYLNSLNTSNPPGGNINENDIIEFINQEGFVYESGSVLDINISGPIISFGSEGTNMVIRDIESTFTLNDKTTKSIMTDIVISDDIPSYPLNTLEKRIVLKDNPLWQQALVANNDIYFDSDNVLINGDVYSYSSLSNIEDITTEDGFVIDGNTSVSVQGNIFSRSMVQLASSSNSSANLNVNQGRVYANTFVLQKGASGEMNINGDVYTKDDLELNGNYGDIYIDGSYYGYADGSSSSLTHDKSSAIVINADMNTNGGATLSITGDLSGVSDPEAYQGILIGGTAYIDASTRYQTSESVSIKGNYISYTVGYDEAIIKSVQNDNFLSNYPYNFFTASHDTEVEERFSKDNIIKQSVTGNVNFAVGYTDGSNSITYDIRDRMAYFLIFANHFDFGFINYGINNGGTQNVNLDNYIYTTGLKLDDHTGANKFYYATDSTGGALNQIDTLQFDEFIEKIDNDVLYQFNMMKRRSVGQVVDEMPPSGQSFETVNSVEKYSKIDGSGTTYPTNTSGYIEVASINGIGDALEVHYIDYRVSQPLNIYGPNHSQTTLIEPYIDIQQRSSGNSDVQGIIITNSDINIYGDIDFTGPIISNGSINIYEGDQSFTNTPLYQNYLAEKIFDDSIIYDMFDVDRFNEHMEDTIYLPDLTITEIIKPDRSYDENHNSIYQASGLIGFEKWKVSE